MSQKHIVQLIDDLDEGTADETVNFSIDGAAYEIDLSDKNAQRLRDALAEFVAHARRSNRGPRPSANGSGERKARVARGDREQTGAIRQWARSNGYKIGDKGRIPANVLEAYNSQN
jgi:outer membrane protein TolC